MDSVKEKKLLDYMQSIGLEYDDLVDYVDGKYEAYEEQYRLMECKEKQEVSSLVPFMLFSKKDWNIAASYADLFFRVVDAEIDERGVLTSFCGKCILCGKTINPFANQMVEGRRMKWQRYRFIDHLRKKHNCVGKQIEVQFNSMEELRRDRDFKEPVPQKGIDSFYSLKRAACGDSIPSKRSNSANAGDSAEWLVVFKPPHCIGAGTGYDIVMESHVMRTMRILVSNIALSWNRRESIADLYWRDQLATYHQSNKMIPLIYENLRILMKQLLPCFSSYSLSCDAWSMPSVNFKAICFFIHVYHQRKYRTLLLDVRSIEGGTAVDIADSLKSVCGYYGLDPNALITTDGASANIKCFGDKRLVCMAHALNTACAHLVSTAKESKKSTLSFEERTIIREYFNTAERICKIFRSDTYDEFVAWYKVHSASRPDGEKVDLTKPNKPCETRWIGKIMYLEWLQKCGVAAYSFLVFQGKKGVDLNSVYNCLTQLPEVYGLLRIMNNALNLLASERTTAHLILPVLYWLKKVFTSLQGKLHSTVASLMLESFLWELKEGCLVLPDDRKHLYMRAAACHPFLAKTTPELFPQCIMEAEKGYEEILGRCTSTQLESLSQSRLSFGKYIQSVLDDVKMNEMLGIDAIPNALKFNALGINGLLLCGSTGGSLRVEALNTLVNRSEESIDKELRKLVRQRNSYLKQRVDPRNVVSKIQFLTNWKLYGASSESDVPNSSLGEKGTDHSVLSQMVSTDSSPGLFDFYQKDGDGREPASDPITLMYESSLHISATEADCERFFRILSLLVQKPYTVKLNGEKACKAAFLRYYSEEIFYAMGSGKEMNKSLYSIMFERDY